MKLVKQLQLTAWIIASMLVSTAILANEDQKNDEKQFLARVRQLIYEGNRSGEGYFSEDGKALIFQSEREKNNPFFQIYILDLESGDSHLISPGIGKTTCAFFRPGANEVLFASTHLDPDVEKKQQEEIEFRASGKKHRYSWDYDEYMDIFVCNRDGSNLQRLTDAPGYDAEGSYSPDGSKIVFSSLRSAYPLNKLSNEQQKQYKMDPAYFGEIYIMNANGSGQTRLTDWPGYDGGPFFTPDGQRIVWRHFEENGMQADVYTMRLDGSGRQRLTDFGAMSWAPYFHPSGKYAIFASNKLGFSNFELYMVDAVGAHEPVRVTFTDGFDGLPAFSPDGNQLCWTSNRTSNQQSQLFMAEWNHQAALAAITAAPVRSTNHQSTERNPAPPRAGNAQATASEKKDQKGFSPEITRVDLKQEVSYLASDKLEGRFTGTNGTRLAAEYITEHFKAAGLQPLGGNGTFLQEFQFISEIKVMPNKNHLQLSHGDEVIRYEVEQDFRPLPLTKDGEVEGEVVFAGYGLSVPGESGEGYDSYAGLDVKDKIVLVLRFVPEEVDMKRRQKLNMFAGLRYKAMAARTNGAKAMLVVSGPNSVKAGELVTLAFDNSAANSGIVAASISGEVAEAMFKQAGKGLKAAQTELDTENPHAQGGFVLPGVKVKLSAAVQRIKKPDYNVVAMLPPGVESSDPEYVVLGAHYDHIGHGKIGSMARKGEEGQIHNGADDNASGTATVLELAASLSAKRQKSPKDFKRAIIFALWSGEELGIIGSSHFVEHPPVAVKKMVAYFNFDMVGRLRENKLILQGLGSSSVWKRLIEKRNVVAGFNLTLQDDPYMPTDVTAFYPKGIPVISFFTDSHEDYNRPTDDAETLNYPGTVRIAKFAQNLILDLVKSAERPDYVKVERTKSEGGGREVMRAYLGTIPDYVGEGDGGVKLSGVRAGGPADKAGLQGGDIIIEFGGQNITNIYDYTFALDAVKIGKPVKVVVVRDGKKMTFTVVPEARE